MMHLEATALMILLFGVLIEGRCQSYFYPSSISNPMPANYSASMGDAFSCASNPSLVPERSKFEAGTFLEKRYLMSDLMVVNVSAASGLGEQGLAVSFQHFGGALYNEKLVILGYGRAIGDIHLGLSFSLLGAYTKDYRSENFVGAGIHSSWKLTGNVIAAFSILNPNSLFVKADDEKVTLPAGFRSGIGYDFSENLYGGIEVLKEQGRQVTVVAAIRYFFDEKYFASSSWTSPGSQPFLTIGWSNKIFRIETGFRYHPVLGFSPAVILYCLPVKTSDR